MTTKSNLPLRSLRLWSLRARVTALCTAAAVLLGLLAISATMLAARNRENLDVVLNKTGVLRISGERLGVALVNQETGVRGFVLSGNAAELAPYTAGREEEENLYAAMIPLLEHDPQVLVQLRRVRASANEWRSVVADPAIAKARAEGPEAAQALLADESKKRFDQTRAEVTKLQTEITALRDKAVAALRSSSDGLVVLLIGAGFIIVLAGAGLVVLLNRMVTRPVLNLAAQVRHVADGAYGTRIVGQGSPELSRLADDIDTMRRQIASDLAEVSEARHAVEAINGQLQAQASELTRSNRDLEQFAYVASHDLQEPLRKVASFCQLLQRRYAGQLDERADQYIGFAVDGAQRMQRLINDLLAFSRIGRNTSGFTPVALNEVMRAVAEQVTNDTQYDQTTLTWDDLPSIQGEEALLGTLLANLVGNSLKFARVDVPAKVHVSALRVGDEWEITVSDNGIGIESEFAEKIFIIFQRLHAKDAYPGTGMGLAIAKKIVEYHGGRIWVAEQQTDGAAITFTLPVGDEAAPVDVEASRPDEETSA
ncbi:CHASE3 domain-containing protein [Catellatospora sp. KI3]|uniref:sensor histidine kinase n=1 Tax=Catellatospora sp. KI3 TaxID=3041620 RepID=UPI0024832CEE|nr:sensor histidine kinase [Catellatospora sp. KI3]MDI1461404.1 CHASE3 domain-containing protein [Catellatospora sp. KI3]